MQAVTTIGLDIAKSVFQVHGVNAEGKVVVRRKLKRRYVVPAVIGPNSDMKRSAPHGASSAAIESKDSCLACLVQRRTMLGICRISSLSPWSRSSVRSR
jgi:hypothetical protein